MNKNKDIPYIKHIIDAINDIEESIKNLTKGKFKKNKDIKDAIIRRLEIIGEASKNISNSLKEKYSNIKWKQISGLRDKLIHAYFGVNLDLVWEVTKKDIPKLKKEIQRILKDLKND